MKLFRDIFCCYIKQRMATKNSAKIDNIFYCEKCDYTCSYTSDFNKHLLTRKHRLATVSNDIVTKKSTHICENCNKEYLDRSGLWRHKKKCFVVQEEENSNTNTTIPTHDNINHIDVDKELLIKMLLKNQDVMEGVLLKNQDFMEKIMEIMPQIGNNSHNENSYNTTNNQFNIQMFLNEHCKDAMNLTDFIESLPITAETYDHTIENGLTKSITKMMITGLSELDILQRPIHCTDASRKTLYVKDDDTWEKDNELLHLLKGIRDLSFKQRVNIHKWQDENEGWDVKDDLQTKITMLVFHTMTDIDNDEKETRKIISAISKNTYLTNEIKNEYK